jgi:glutamate formiminotransferase/formiminotetrahydrofolate cyclodeaminase
MDAANRYAAEVPLRVMQKSMEAYSILQQMAENGNPASITDVGVGALCVHTCVQGAGLNVRINLSGLADLALRTQLSTQVANLIVQSQDALSKVMEVVESKM